MKAKPGRKRRFVRFFKRHTHYRGGRACLSYRRFARIVLNNKRARHYVKNISHLPEVDTIWPVRFVGPLKNLLSSSWNSYYTYGWMRDREGYIHFHWLRVDSFPPSSFPPWVIMVVLSIGKQWTTMKKGITSSILEIIV